MALTSNDRERPAQLDQTRNDNSLRPSNLTSGHFLGSIPRDWMLKANTGNTTNPNSDSFARNTHLSNIAKAHLAQTSHIKDIETTQIPSLERTTGSVPAYHQRPSPTVSDTTPQDIPFSANDNTIQRDNHGSNTAPPVVQNDTNVACPLPLHTSDVISSTVHSSQPPTTTTSITRPISEPSPLENTRNHGFSTFTTASAVQFMNDPPRSVTNSRVNNESVFPPTHTFSAFSTTSTAPPTNGPTLSLSSCPVTGRSFNPPNHAFSSTATTSTAPSIPVIHPSPILNSGINTRSSFPPHHAISPVITVSTTRAVNRPSPSTSNSVVDNRSESASNSVFNQSQNAARSFSSPNYAQTDSGNLNWASRTNSTAIKFNALPNTLPPLSRNVRQTTARRMSHGLKSSQNTNSAQNLLGYQMVLDDIPSDAREPAVELPELLRLLNTRISNVERQKPLRPADFVRLTWLRGACQWGDSFYLLLHQLSCLLSVHPQFVKSRLAFSSLSIEGLSVVNQILVDDTQITPEILSIFCNFVTPVAEFEQSVPLRQWLPRTREFLTSFRPRWEKLRAKVFERGCPPSASEIAIDLGSACHVLAQAIYTNFVYQLFPYCGINFTQEGFNLFRRSQDNFIHHVSGAAPGPDQQQLATQDLQIFLVKFRELAQQHKQKPLSAFQSLNPTFNQEHQASATPNHRGRLPHLVQSNSPLHHIPQPQVSDPQGCNVQRGSQPVTSSDLSSRVQVQSTLPPLASGESRIFPNPGQRQMITLNPAPDRCALHQAHLKNPSLFIEGIDPTSDTKPRLYSYIECVIIEPKLIDKDTVFETWPSISVPHHVFDRRAEDQLYVKNIDLATPSRIVRNGSVIFIMRCVDATNTSDIRDLSLMSSLATKWPEHLFLSLNGTHLEFRRKVHYGRDQPVDVTNLIQRDDNEISVAFHLNKHEIGKTFALLVEVVNILDHKEVSKLPISVNATESLAKCVQSLRQGHEDDDIVMTDSHVSIDLIDPFLARIFDVPVRGRSCLHRECFDLDSFLQSRMCRYNDGLVQSDEWKCPLCGNDARPSSLIIDNFLLDVKVKLVADGKSDTKAILVKEDGSWEPKLENVGASKSEHSKQIGERVSTRSPSTTSDTKYADVTAVQTRGSNSTSVEPEYIVLDDD